MSKSRRAAILKLKYLPDEWTNLTWEHNHFEYINLIHTNEKRTTLSTYGEMSPIS